MQNKIERLPTFLHKKLVLEMPYFLPKILFLVIKFDKKKKNIVYKNKWKTNQSLD